MMKKDHKSIHNSLYLFDLSLSIATLLASFIVSYYIKFFILDKILNNDNLFDKHFMVYIKYLAISVIFMLFDKGSTFPNYNNNESRRLYHFSTSLKFCLKLTLLLIVLSYLFKANPVISRYYVFIFMFTLLIFLSIKDYFFTKIFKNSAFNTNIKLAIIGDDKVKPQEYKSTCVYFETEELFPTENYNTENSKLDVLTNFDVVILSSKQLTKLQEALIVSYCDKNLIEVKIVPTSFDILISSLSINQFLGIMVLERGLINLNISPYNYAKRLSDIIGSIFGLLVSTPIMLIFVVLIFKESPGPVIYKQKRMGKNGKIFTIYKLRSMKLDAESDGQAKWAKEVDNRRLKIGSFMRKCNIDELPQFFNVLKGDMSLVGPRPERPELIKSFKDEINNYNLRHKVKPGMTGWAQINGFRGNTSLEKRIQYDLYYIENWSIIFDFEIMILTFVKNKNAY